ncbi:MAG: glycosyltransferase [bacterium]
MKKKRVAFFTSAARGLAHYVMHLIPEMSKDVDSYYVTYAGQEIDDLVQEKVKKIYPIIKNQSASSILEIIKFLKEKKIDAINIQVSDTVRRMHLQYSAIIAYAKYMGIPVCLTIHDVLTAESMYIDPSAIELLYMMGDSFIVGNEPEREKLKFYFNKKDENIVTVKHGPYTMFDRNKYTSEKAKKELGLSGKKVILFFGQIRPNKGLKYLIKALPSIIKQHPDTVLYISTDVHMSTPELNEYMKRVEKLGADKHIRLVREYIPSKSIERLFKAADIVSLPYTQVSQSGVLNLAYAFKKPVVISDVFSEKNEVDGKFGRVFKSGDYKGLAEAINSILSLDDLGKSMGQSAYDISKSKAGWDIAGRETFKAIELAEKFKGFK